MTPVKSNQIHPTRGDILRHKGPGISRSQCRGKGMYLLLKRLEMQTQGVRHSPGLASGSDKPVINYILNTIQKLLGELKFLCNASNYVRE